MISKLTGLCLTGFGASHFWLGNRQRLLSWSTYLIPPADSWRNSKLFSVRVPVLSVNKCWTWMNKTECVDTFELLFLDTGKIERSPLKYLSEFLIEIWCVSFCWLVVLGIVHLYIPTKKDGSKKLLKFWKKSQTNGDQCFARSFVLAYVNICHLTSAKSKNRGEIFNYNDLPTVTYKDIGIT